MIFSKTNRPRAGLSQVFTRSARRRRRHARFHDIEALEGRQLLSTMAGTVPHDTGHGHAGPGHALVEPTVRVKGGTEQVKLHSRSIGLGSTSGGVTYFNTNHLSVPVSLWQGLRGGFAKGQVLISGTSGVHGLLFSGKISGQGTTSFVDYPGAFSTSVYGPNNLGNGNIELVGSYRSGNPLDPVAVHGFVFQGTTANLPSGGTYTTIDYPGSVYNYVHSTMGGLAVGNYDLPAQSGSSLLEAHDYIYNIAAKQFVTSIVYPGSTSDTAYGIWWNGGTSYTIVGGYSNGPASNATDQNVPIGQGYIVDYNSATNSFSNWTSIGYPAPAGSNLLTHFEGISALKPNVYTLNADSLSSGSSGNTGSASLVTVRREPNGTFKAVKWVNLSYPGVSSGLSSNAVYGNDVVGITLGSNSFAYQAVVHPGARGVR